MLGLGVGSPALAFGERGASRVPPPLTICDGGTRMFALPDSALGRTGQALGERPVFSREKATLGCLDFGPLQKFSAFDVFW